MALICIYIAFDKDSSISNPIPNELRTAYLSDLLLTEKEREDGYEVKEAWRGKKDIDSSADSLLMERMKRAFGNYDEYGDEYDDSMDVDSSSSLKLEKALGDSNIQPIIIKRNSNHTSMKGEFERILEDEDEEGEGEGEREEREEGEKDKGVGENGGRGRGGFRGGGRGKTPSGITPAPAIRASNEKNKASRANHNRKRGAAKKIRATGILG